MDEAFTRWALHSKPEDEVFWENWMRNNPDRIPVATAAARLIRDLHFAQEYLSEDQLNEELDRLAKTPKTRGNKLKLTLDSKWQGKLLAFAALLACVFGLYYYSTSKASHPYAEHQARLKHKHGELREITNKEPSPMSIKLPDGSMVSLFPHSTLSYSERFVNDKREVFLNGEAFFNVIKNPLSPFKVYANEITTTVLGTSFTVRAFDDDLNAQVVVRTGKVTVTAVATGTDQSEQGNQNELVLLPNQQVVYSKQEQRLKRSLVNNPLPVAASADRSLVFDQAPVTAVLDSLVKRYGVQIVYDADLLSGCQLTAELGKEPLFEKVGLICKAIDARYEMIDGQIVIHGKSCN